MSEERERWDERYRVGGATPEPLAALREYSFLLPNFGTALDLACGRAANAQFLAEQGLQTSAWDISAVVVDQVSARFSRLGIDVDAQARDAVNHPPDSGSFDVIVVANFLERQLAPAIVDALRPGGLLFYQTFVVDKVSSGGPSNPEYRLAPGELLELFSALLPRVYLDLGSLGDALSGLRNQALLVAQKSADTVQ